MPGKGGVFGWENDLRSILPLIWITALYPISHYRHQFLEVIYFQIQKKIKWAISL